MRNQHEEMIAAAMAAQRQIGRALHAATEPTWLQLDLTMGQLKALFVLADEALTVGGLAEALRIGKPAASILVERLVQLGLVTRAEDVADRRRTLVRLTPEGETLAARLRQGGQDSWRALLSRLDEADLAALLQGLQALARLVAAASEPVATPA
jgi:DNA-binding MarR family transcriptional regulator